MIVVDTNVWSEATKREPSPVVRDWARRHQDALWLSAVVLAELRGGTAQLPVGRRRRSLEDQFDLLEADYADRLLRFDSLTARHYAGVLESAKQRGKPIATADAMIAATAIQHGMTVATRDLGDFAGAAVELINPWKA
jgi:predicted nucleic acid-binding protein